MKTFIITRNFLANAGYAITVVKAVTKEEALKKYRMSLNMSCLPIGLQVEELIGDVREVYRYDNPTYGG